MPASLAPAHPWLSANAFENRGQRAFTILEILVVLAIIAVLAGIFVVSIQGMSGGLGARPLPEILQKAVRDARYQSALTKEVVTLSFDHEAGAFRVRGPDGGELAQRESGYGPDNNAVVVRFEQILPREGMGSRAQDRRAPLEAVRFHPDQSSTPFVALLEIEGRRSEHRFDPFSNLELVDAP